MQQVKYSLRSISNQHFIHNKNALCLLLGLAAGFWTFFYTFVGDRVVKKFIPHDARKVIDEKKKLDPEFAKQCKTNGTGFFHALVVSPLMLLCMHQLAYDRYNADSLFFYFASIFVTGYFMWDVAVCVLFFKHYGTPFLIHALMALSCLVWQLCAKEYRTGWVISAMTSTELSTVLLHIRWFLLEASCTNRLYFTFVNCAFLACFVGYRCMVVPAYVLVPYTQWLIQTPPATAKFTDLARNYYQALCCWVWAGLQVYWATLLITSQWRHQRKMTNKKE